LPDSSSLRVPMKLACRCTDRVHRAPSTGRLGACPPVASLCSGRSHRSSRVGCSENREIPTRRIRCGRESARVRASLPRRRARLPNRQGLGQPGQGGSWVRSDQTAAGRRPRRFESSPRRLDEDQRNGPRVGRRGEADRSSAKRGPPPATRGPDLAHPRGPGRWAVGALGARLGGDTATHGALRQAPTLRPAAGADVVALHLRRPRNNLREPPRRVRRDKQREPVAARVRGASKSTTERKMECRLSRGGEERGFFASADRQWQRPTLYGAVAPPTRASMPGGARGRPGRRRCPPAPPGISNSSLARGPAAVASKGLRAGDALGHRDATLGAQPGASPIRRLGLGYPLRHTSDRRQTSHQSC